MATEPIPTGVGNLRRTFGLLPEQEPLKFVQDPTNFYRESKHFSIGIFTVTRQNEIDRMRIF